MDVLPLGRDDLDPFQKGSCRNTIEVEADVGECFENSLLKREVALHQWLPQQVL